MSLSQNSVLIGIIMERSVIGAAPQTAVTAAESQLQPVSEVVVPLSIEGKGIDSIFRII
jgi:hypothetical protein